LAQNHHIRPDVVLKPFMCLHYTFYVHERFIRLQSIRYSCWSKILVNSTISYGGRVRLGLESPSTDPDVLLLGGSLLEPRRWAGSVRRYAISAKVWTNCGGAL